MGRDKLPPIQDSREGGRVLILVIVFAVMMLTLISLATSRSIAASADLFRQLQAGD